MTLSLRESFEVGIEWMREYGAATSVNHGAAAKRISPVLPSTSKSTARCLVRAMVALGYGDRPGSKYRGADAVILGYGWDVCMFRIITLHGGGAKPILSDQITRAIRCKRLNSPTICFKLLHLQHYKAVAACFSNTNGFVGMLRN